MGTSPKRRRVDISWVEGGGNWGGRRENAEKKSSNKYRISVSASVYEKLKNLELQRKYDAKGANEIIEALLDEALLDAVDRKDQNTEASSSLPRIISRKGRKPKDFSDVSPKVTLLQTKMFRQFVSKVVCANKMGTMICGEKLNIVAEQTLGCPAMKFILKCSHGHKTGFF